MITPRTKTGALIGLIVLLVLAVGGVVGFRIAVGILKGTVLEALGPDSEIGQLDVGWAALRVAGLRLKGRQGWPAADTLRAERVVIVPSLRSLLSARIQVGSVTVVRPYLSALRTKEGKLLAVPSPLADRRSRPGRARPVGAQRGDLARQPGRRRAGALRRHRGAAAPEDPPRADPRDGPGPARPDPDGQEPARGGGGDEGREARRPGPRLGMARSRQQGLVPEDPDAVGGPAGVPALPDQGRGHTPADGGPGPGSPVRVRRNQLGAPGKVVLSDLEFAPARGARETFLGVPRAAVVSLLKSRDDKIEVHFIIEGDSNNPRFALNEAFATRIASALAEKLGVSLRGAAEGAASLGRKGVAAAGDAVKGVGDALKDLFGGKQR